MSVSRQSNSAFQEYDRTYVVPKSIPTTISELSEDISISGERSMDEAAGSPDHWSIVQVGQQLVYAKVQEHRLRVLQIAT